MASESETLADIVADMRKRCTPYAKSDSTDCRYVAYLGYKEFADRIESAWRRECESVGNSAAMREALVKIHDLTNALDEKCGVDPVEIRDIARAALSAPARNCDMYATYAEAAEAYKEYATAYIMRASNKFDFPMEFDEWLFAPAAERKGEGDGR